MKMLTVGAEIFHSDKQRNENIDGQTQVIKLKVSLNNFETRIKVSLTL